MLSFLKTYLGESGDVTTVWIQLVTPTGRKATTYPNPSPFCSSSGTGYKGKTYYITLTRESMGKVSGATILSLS